MSRFAPLPGTSGTSQSPCSATMSILMKKPKSFLTARSMPHGFSPDRGRKNICSCSSSSGEASLIQRDLLRQCYLSEQLAETFKFCESKLEYIDSDTAYV